MSPVDRMLERVQSDSSAADLLSGYFEFDLTRDEPVEELRLTSNSALVPIAGDSTGGCYFLGGEGERRPVFFATSEGAGGLLAADLTEALELIIGLPYWRDCLKFSAGGSLDEMRCAAARLEHDLRDKAQIAQQREELRRELRLPVTSTDDLLTRLHESVARTEPDFALVDIDGNPYGSLFNTRRVSDNPAWR
jgi:hypothetical protein